MTPAPVWHAFAVAAGGAAGALLRFATNELFLRRGWYGLPAATLAVNVIGCALTGMMLVWLETRLELTALWRNALMVGLLGGLTTFSALGLELWQLLRAGRTLLAMGTLAAHAVLGVTALWLGWRLAQLFWSVGPGS